MFTCVLGAWRVILNVLVKLVELIEQRLHETICTSSLKLLVGIRQYVKTVAFHPLTQVSFENKVNALVELLSSIDYNQCLVFSNYQMR